EVEEAHLGYGADVAQVLGQDHVRRELAYAAMLLPALLSSGAGVGALMTSLSGAAVAEVPQERLATGAALSVTSRACAAVIGLSTLALVLAGQPRDSIGAYLWIWTTMTLLCLLLALAAARLPAREPAGRNTGS
ncbi:MAG: hypothetical protein ACRDOO_17495, partial [Actinomadura sp.]